MTSDLVILVCGGKRNASVPHAARAFFLSILFLSHSLTHSLSPSVFSNILDSFFFRTVIFVFAKIGRLIVLRFGKLAASWKDRRPCHSERQEKSLFSFYHPWNTLRPCVRSCVCVRPCVCARALPLYSRTWCACQRQIKQISLGVFVLDDSNRHKYRKSTQMLACSKNEIKQELMRFVLKQAPGTERCLKSTLTWCSQISKEMVFRPTSKSEILNPTIQIRQSAFSQNICKHNYGRRFELWQEALACHALFHLRNSHKRQR